MKTIYLLLMVIFMTTSGCRENIALRVESVRQGSPEWTDFRRGDLQQALGRLGEAESESEAISILGTPDKVDASGSEKKLYWVAGSRRGGSPREGVAPTFHVSYQVIGITFSPQRKECEIRFSEYIGHEQSPDPFSTVPTVTELKKCSEK